MISDTSRKRITLAALISVLSILAGMFAVFLQSDERLTAIALLLLGLNIVLYSALIWLGVSLYFFHKEETSGIVEMGSTVIIEQGINKEETKWKHPLFHSSLSLIVGGSIAIPIQVVTGLVFIEVFTLPNPELLLNLISILPAAIMLFGFIQLKRELDVYAAKKRNIYKGQTSLPIGFLMVTIYAIMISIFPIDVLFVETAEGLAIRGGYEIVYYIISFLEIGQDVMFVLGFWYLRRVFTVLDKVPEEYFERKQQIIEQTQARRQQGIRGGIFGGSRTLGTVLPQTPIKEEPKEDDTEFAEELDIKKMFCVKCGLELEDEAVFCANCGKENPYLKR